MARGDPVSVTIVWVIWPGLPAPARIIPPHDLGAYLAVPGLQARRRRARLSMGVGSHRAPLGHLARMEGC